MSDAFLISCPGSGELALAVKNNSNYLIGWGYRTHDGAEGYCPNTSNIIKEVTIEDYKKAHQLRLDGKMSELHKFLKSLSTLA